MNESLNCVCVSVSVPGHVRRTPYDTGVSASNIADIVNEGMNDLTVSVCTFVE